MTLTITVPIQTAPLSDTRKIIAVILTASALLAAAPAAAQVPSALPTSAPAIFGDVGESCRARADCRPGLRCLANVCRHPREGEACGAAADCGDAALACRHNRCVGRHVVASISAAAPALAPAHAQPTLQRSAGGGGWQRSSRFEGNTGFVGIVGGPGVTEVFDLDGDYSSTESGSLFALRGGLLFGRTELSLEIAPRSSSPVEDVSQFSMLLSVGYYFQLSEHVYWPIRYGLGMVAGDTYEDRVNFQTRLDLIGIAVRWKGLMFELSAPSARVATDFEDIGVASWVFGFGVTYIL